jgi:hypothetical protein
VGEALTKSRNWKADFGGAILGEVEDISRRKDCVTSLVTGDDEDVSLAGYVTRADMTAGIYPLY